MAIDIGADCIDRGTAGGGGYTYVSKDNPANAGGTITSVDIWAASTLIGCKVGIFYTTNGNTLKCRDSVVIGDVTAGSKQTFSGLSLSVETGDCIGIYFSPGNMEMDSSGYGGLWYKLGDHMEPGDETTYTFLGGYAISVYGTGGDAAPKGTSQGHLIGS